MSKEPTFLEATLPMVRELYEPRKNNRIEKMQQNIAVGMITGMISIQKAAERVHAQFQEITKSNGR